MHMGSPRLTEEELILTLYTYREIGRGESFSDTHPRISWLSQVLRQLPIHPPEDRPEDVGFRTPDGLASRVRAFKLIDEDRNPRKLNSYRKVWDRYEGDWQTLEADAKTIIEKYGVGATKSREIQEERRRREKLWDRLKREGGPLGVDPSLLRELGIYQGQAGIWRDKSQTGHLTEDGSGVTVSVLHTGQSYPDDLTEEELIYHYPDTDRVGSRDANEVEATKKAGRLDIPLFVILYGENDQSSRHVYRGRVLDWNDETAEFLIRFDTDGERLESEVAKARRQVDFELTDGSPTEERTRKARPGQATFRFEVFKRYGSKCAVCDVDIKALLEAAHIRPKEYDGTDDPRNGLVLCRNHHAAFDQGLFKVDPDTFRVTIPDSGPSKEEIGIETSTLEPLREMPHEEALRWKWDRQE